ncbi:hypothetical protein [Nannocystis radixulma]|uniref:Uncharacterized protein n=1 Tax=Nannocystis radixulma TaxID=2995305 RepID=A0ABT5BFK9_9BACT|nr:hypothetical protein [Nannocystis radixulma]MDC0672867.1 hypothetical protein [Nannocystis radixulma]
MPESQLEIRNLSVRVPGDDGGAGERLAAGLRETLEAVPIARSKQLGALRLNVRVAHGATEAETLRAVQRALTQALHQE